MAAAADADDHYDPDPCSIIHAVFFDESRCVRLERLVRLVGSIWKWALAGRLTS